jgi:hypothetical protein
VYGEALQWRQCREETVQRRDGAAREEGGSGRLVEGVLAGWRVLLVVAIAGGGACGGCKQGLWAKTLLGASG